MEAAPLETGNFTRSPMLPVLSNIGMKSNVTLASYVPPVISSSVAPDKTISRACPGTGGQTLAVAVEIVM